MVDLGHNLLASVWQDTHELFVRLKRLTLLEIEVGADTLGNICIVLVED
jgi:hypothetical protein